MVAGGQWSAAASGSRITRTGRASGSASRVFQAAADIGGAGGPVAAGDLLPLERRLDVDAEGPWPREWTRPRLQPRGRRLKGEPSSGHHRTAAGQVRRHPARVRHRHATSQGQTRRPRTALAGTQNGTFGAAVPNLATSARSPGTAGIFRAGQDRGPVRDVTWITVPLGYGLLADAAVDPLAEQIGVAEVAGVLLDHVEYHLAQRDGRAVLQRAADGEVG